MNKIINDQPKRRSKSAVFGFVMILVGLVIISNQLDLIPFKIREVLFTWQALLIVIGVVFVTTRDQFTGYILMGVGAFFLLPDLVDMQWEYRRLFWPSIFIIMGIVIIFKGSGYFHHRHFSKRQDDADYIDDINLFGGGDRKVSSNNFKGGSIISVFGGGKYDLRHATLNKDKCIIEMVSLFGGSNLIVPSDWNVKSEMIGIFGGFSDKRQIIDPNPDKTLIIKGVALFGGGDIKSLN